MKRLEEASWDAEVDPSAKLGDDKGKCGTLLDTMIHHALDTT